MTQTTSPKKIPVDELIDREARRIATTLLQTRLEAQGLPLPKDSALAIHVDQILTLRPDIRQTAKEVVDARRDAYSEGLKAIGITVEIETPIVGIEL